MTLLLHDVGDVFLIIARSYNDIKDKNNTILAILMGNCLIVWFWTRLFHFPIVSIKPAFLQAYYGTFS